MPLACVSPCLFGVHIDVDAIVTAAGTALLIIVLTIIAARIVRRIVRRSVRRTTLRSIKKLGNQELQYRAELRATTLSTVMSGVVSTTIMTMGIVMALAEIGANIGPLVAGAGIIGVALGFGAQSLVKDFFSGFFILLEDQYGIGDVIDAGGQAFGEVEDITLRVTRVRSMDGTVWFVPNGEIRQLGNKTKEYAQAVFDIGIGYDADIDEAIALMIDVASQMAQDDEYGPRLRDQLQVLGVNEWGESAVVIRAVLRTGPSDRWPVQREYNRRLKYAFDAAGIEIPFPHRRLIMSTDDGPAVEKPVKKATKKTATKSATKRAAK